MKFQSYNNFRQRIQKCAKEKEFPLRVMFELTYRCNFKCKHCYVPPSYRKKGELKREGIFSILDQLKDMGCFYLGFTGGEPFVRNDIMDILWYAKKKGFELIIYTNGSLIDEGIAERLGRLRPSKVDVTIPAMSNASFERVSGVRGSRDQVFKAIDLLHKKGVNLGFKSCVLRENESEIKDIQDFAASLGALHRLDDKLFPRLDGSKEPYEYRGKLDTLSSLDEKCDLLNPTNLTNSTNSTKITDTTRTSHKLFKCGVGKNQAAITPLGELKMCLMIDEVRFATRGSRLSVNEAWRRLKDFVASIKPDENYRCNKCELYTYCKWCPARGWLYKRSFTACEAESRLQAASLIRSTKAYKTNRALLNEK